MGSKKAAGAFFGTVEDSTDPKGVLRLLPEQETDTGARRCFYKIMGDLKVEYADNTNENGQKSSGTGYSGIAGFCVADAPHSHPADHRI